MPQYSGLVLPDPCCPTASCHRVIRCAGAERKGARRCGKIGTVLLPDQTAYGESFKYHFANYNLNKEPHRDEFLQPIRPRGDRLVSFRPHFSIVGCVLDPNTEAENFVSSDSFENVNLYLTSALSYDIGGLPGQVSAVYTCPTSRRPIWIRRSERWVDAERRQAIGSLLGVASAEGFPPISRMKAGSHM